MAEAGWGGGLLNSLNCGHLFNTLKRKWQSGWGGGGISAPSRKCHAERRGAGEGNYLFLPHTTLPPPHLSAPPSRTHSPALPPSHTPRHEQLLARQLVGKGQVGWWAGQHGAGQTGRQTGRQAAYLSSACSSSTMAAELAARWWAHTPALLPAVAAVGAGHGHA